MSDGKDLAEFLPSVPEVLRETNLAVDHDTGEAYNADDPAIASLLPIVELPTKPTQEVAEQKDLAMHNFQIAAAAAFWPKVRSVDSACKLALTISKLMRDRREAAGLRNGPDTGSQGASGKVWSVD